MYESWAGKVSVNKVTRSWFLKEGLDRQTGGRTALQWGTTMTLC